MTAGQSKKVLVTGVNGQLGRELLRSPYAKNYQIEALSKGELNITDRDLVFSHIAELRPNVIINTAAYTAVDQAESEKDKAFAVNAYGAGNIAEAAAVVSARLVHVSTDYVFDGRKNRPYEAIDLPAPLNVYGHSKWEGEKQVLEAAPELAMIIRTSWMYSVFGTNFVKTILRLIAEREEIAVVSDQVGTPTWAKGLADVIWRSVSGKKFSGIYHWRDEGVASWYDFAVAVMEEAHSVGLVDRKVKIRPVTTEEYPVAAVRPCYNVLRKDRSIGGGALVDLHWRASLRKMLDDYRDQRAYASPRP